MKLIHLQPDDISWHSLSLSESTQSRSIAVKAQVLIRLSLSYNTEPSLPYVPLPLPARTTALRGLANKSLAVDPS